MNGQPIRITGNERITPGPEADRLALEAYDVIIAELGSLSPDEWYAPTECTPWTVHDMVAHLVGAAKGHASVRHMMRQAMYGRRHKHQFQGSDLDAMNQLQIDDHHQLSPNALISELRRLAPKAVAGRARLARRMGPVTIKLSQSGSSYAGMPDQVSLRELATVVLTRDVWMHRLDIARAVGGEPTMTDSLDGRLITDLVSEWSQRHGKPVLLTLRGPVGGTFVVGDDGEGLQLDALDFVRVLAGRAPAGDVPTSELLQTKALF